MSVIMEKELNEACMNGDLSSVRKILGKTLGHYPQALERSIKYGRSEIVKHLLENGTAPTRQSVLTALESRSQEVLKLLLKHGGKTLLKSKELDQGAANGEPALYKMMIECNCPITENSLSYALSARHFSMLKVLMTTEFPDGEKLIPGAKFFSRAILVRDPDVLKFLTSQSSRKIEDWSEGIAAAVGEGQSLKECMILGTNYLNGSDFDLLKKRVSFLLQGFVHQDDVGEDAA